MGRLDAEDGEGVKGEREEVIFKNIFETFPPSSSTTPLTLPLLPHDCLQKVGAFARDKNIFTYESNETFYFGTTMTHSQPLFIYYLVFQPGA